MTVQAILGLMGGVVGKCVSKENPKFDLDLDLGFVKIHEADWRSMWRTAGPLTSVSPPSKMFYNNNKQTSVD